MLSNNVTNSTWVTTNASNTVFTNKHNLPKIIGRRKCPIRLPHSNYHDVHSHLEIYKIKKRSTLPLKKNIIPPQKAKNDYNEQCKLTVTFI